MFRHSLPRRGGFFSSSAFAQKLNSATRNNKTRWFSTAAGGFRRSAMFLLASTTTAATSVSFFAVVYANSKAQPQQQQQEQQQVKNTFKAIRERVARILEDKPEMGATFVRLAWHAAGTYDASAKVNNDGYSNMASMRFAPECRHAANAGLQVARDLLEPIHAAYPTVSYADLWVLASLVAIEEAGGPVIPFRWGRPDALSTQTAPDGRLPDASKGQDHIRDVFTRMGFSDAEAVALIGAHTIGRCHPDRSGYSGPWTHDAIGFDSAFFTELLENDWIVDVKVPKLQFTDSKTRKLMMLPTDVALLLDPAYRRVCTLYANDMGLFHADFAKAYQKLVELGIPKDKLRSE